MGVMPHPAQPSQPDMMATSYQSGGMDSLDGEGMVMGGDLTPTGMSPVLVHYMGGGGARSPSPMQLGATPPCPTGMYAMEAVPSRLKTLQGR